MRPFFWPDASVDWSRTMSGKSGKGAIRAFFKSVAGTTAQAPAPNAAPPAGPGPKAARVLKKIVIWPVVLPAAQPGQPVPLGAGRKLSFRARAYYDDNSSPEVTDKVAWKPDPAGMLSIDSKGAGKADRKAGPVKVTATLDGVPSNEITVVVTVPTLQQAKRQVWVEGQLCSKLFTEYGDSVAAAAKGTVQADEPQERLTKLNEQVDKLEDAVNDLRAHASAILVTSPNDQTGLDAES